MQSKPQKEGSESEQFWDLLGGKSEYPSQKDGSNVESDPHLFSCSFSTDSSSTLDQKIAAALRLIVPREKRGVPTVAKHMQKLSMISPNGEGLDRCNWITANSGRLNMDWVDPDQSPGRENEAFQRAMMLAGGKFMESIHFHAKMWLSARSIVMECLAARKDVDSTGESMLLTRTCPAQMNDASEVLGVIFDCLHRSFTSGFGVSDTESVESNVMGSWDCENSTYVAHSLFGMNVFESLNCYNCGMESKNMKYTSFFHNINASALRTMKVICLESSFDELRNFVEMSDQFTCDPEAGGCVLGWQNTCESVDDIRATLMAFCSTTFLLYWLGGYILV